MAREFLVSTADFVLKDKTANAVVCTGYTNSNASISVAMQTQELTGGKGAQRLYMYKYGRTLDVNLETVNFDLRYIAANTGSKITSGLKDVYVMGECVDLTAGVGTLSKVPVSTTVAVELPSGLIVEITPTGSSIDLTKQGLTTESVKVTYQYNTETKSITIDASTSPEVYELVMHIDKHNSDKGKVGTLEIVIPSYQVSGEFEITLTPDGSATTTINGSALAVDGITCSDGKAVYAYLNEIPDDGAKLPVIEIAATPATVTLSLAGTTTQTITVTGIRGEMFSTQLLTNTDCTFTSDTPATATVDASGVITAVATGTSVVTVTYMGVSDTIDVTVTA